ncbi:MAG: hypothetical protein JW919_05420 [Candidatus Omnitrophica bacterium]|nr:hypothetical protein [Candidatus Omnitrophota bacterium]
MKLKLGMMAIVAAAVILLAASAFAVEYRYKYRNDGAVMTKTRCDTEGDPVARASYRTDGTVEKFERFDRKGRLTVVAHYNEKGKLEENIDGWSARILVYKGEQLRIESYYGDDGHLTERKFYNDSGDLVERQFVGDSRLDPNEEFSAGPIAWSETDQFYDSYGDLKGEEEVSRGYW